MKSALGSRLKHAMLKIVRRKVLEEKDKKLRNDMLRIIDRPKHLDQKDTDGAPEGEATFSHALERKIKEELDERDSISSAVFESMMRNETIRKDVMRELQS